ncbi:MAG: helix-turn-helix domain-containing protein [Solirubrobacterales bacterium]
MASTGQTTTRAASSRPLLAREFVYAHKRRRLFAALAELTSEQGYEATSISDIVRRAAVARKTLYDSFSGKEELLLDAVDDAIAAAFARIEAACAGEGEWPERVEAGLAALLAELAEQPDRAHLWIVVAPAAAPASAQRYDEAQSRFLALLRATAPRATAPPAPVEESLIGGVAWVLHRQLRSGDAERAPELLPDLSALVIDAYGARPSKIAP